MCLFGTGAGGAETEAERHERLKKENAAHKGGDEDGRAQNHNNPLNGLKQLIRSKNILTHKIFKFSRVRFS